MDLSTNNIENGTENYHSLASHFTESRAILKFVYKITVMLTFILKNRILIRIVGVLGVSDEMVHIFKVKFIYSSMVLLSKKDVLFIEGILIHNEIDSTNLFQ